MKPQFALEFRDEAADYLRLTLRSTAKKGELLYRNQAVQNLACKKPGLAYTATVVDEWSYGVELSYEPMDGWIGECDCDQTLDCAHAYAMMKALLAESTAENVRLLSSGNAPKAREPQPPPDALMHLVARGCGRPLKTFETKFLQKVKEIFNRCRMAGRINGWDFHEMGFPISVSGWESLQIWPAMPKSEHEFWLYVANAAVERKMEIPEFMRPITDFTSVQEAIRVWRRQREIDRWKEILRGSEAPDTGATPGTPTDLRIKFLQESARLEILSPGTEEFRPLKPAQFRQLMEERSREKIDFTNEGEILWEPFYKNYFAGRGADLRYSDGEIRRSLARFFRLPLLAARLVNADGNPIERSAEGLRWRLVEPETPEGDYRMSLVQADGQPLSNVICELPGHPPSYLTLTKLYPGPPHSSAFASKGENLVPAPALETPAGLRLLHGLRAVLPPRLQDRVRQVPLQVRIHCELGLSAGAASENCWIKIEATSPSGQLHELWDGEQWRKSIHEHQVPAEPGIPPGTVVFYDRSALHQVGPLVAPLDLKSDVYSGRLWIRVTRQFPEVFGSWLESLPKDITVLLNGDLATLQSGSLSGRVRLDVTEAEIDWFDLRVIVDVNDTTLSEEELKLLMDARGKFVRLTGKGWRRLQFDVTEEEDEKLARLGLNPRQLTSEPQRLHALQLADEAAERFLEAEQITQLKKRAGEIKARVTPPIPSDITAELRPYQVEGFNFLAYLSANRFGGILADDMGLGKTLQTLTWLSWLREESAKSGQPVKPTLVVCPKSVMDNWKAEAARFTKDLKVKMWAASELPELVDKLGEASVHVLNYSQLRLVGESLAPIRWLAVILDEGQYIKNPSSQTAQVARALRAEHRLVLSGTPIENRLMDLWSLMAFAMPGVLGSRPQFAKLYDAKEDPRARRRLSARIRPFLLRRTKTQVAKDLPDRIEEDLYCEIEGEQLGLYRAELKKAQQMLLKVKTQKQLAKEQFHFLVSLLRLRQICCDPRLVKPEARGPYAKMEALIEQIEPLIEEGQKVLVFSQFVDLLELLRTELSGKGWPLFYLAGDTENRGDLVQQFQGTSGAAVFLISLKAGGFGLNLTAASYVILFDPWWNPAVERQAIDRTHRIGQVNKVIAYRLLIKDSIEEKIRALQKQKSALADDVLGEEKFAQNLTVEDLHFLFAD